MKPYTRRTFEEMELPVDTKDRVRALLDRLPDDCTLDDVLYHLYVFQAVELGLEDAGAGRMLPHDEVIERLREKWLPVPESHLVLVEERIEEHRRNPTGSRSAYEMLDEIARRVAKT